LIGKGLKSLSAYATTFLQTGLGVVMLLPMVDFSEFQGLTLGNWLAIIMTGVIHTGIVYVLYFDSIRYLSTSIISVLVFLDPAIAILLDVMLMDVRPNVMQGLGIVLIFFGMALTFIKFKRRAV
ncbi:MAG: DMT family transporter, partial [Lysinibacillus sp.]